MTTTAHKLVSMQELADRWSCSKGKVHRMFHAGEITAAIVSGKLVRFDVAAVECEMAERARTLAARNTVAL